MEDLVIGFLDFPKGGTFGLDGQNIVLQTDDFVGVKEVPRNAFHLVTCKNGHGTSLHGKNNNNNQNTIDTAVTVGFLVFGDEDCDNDIQSSGGGHLVRKYDPQTEEVASQERSPVDELTQQNLVQQMKDGSLPPSRVLRYDQIISGGGANADSTANQEEQAFLSQQRVWREQTRYIRKDNSSSQPSISLLKDIRKLSSGDKIVPGCYDPQNETTTNGPSTTTATTVSTTENDGKSLVYPPIPVVDPGLSLAKHKHHGTNRFLSRLEPQERTSLFLQSSSLSRAQGNFVWLDRVLQDCYKGSWEALLGDLQLSYLLFLYLGCYASLEHWKDLLAMLSLAVAGIGNTNREQRPKHPHESLYRGLLRLLPYQLSSMKDPEFLEDMDEGGGNFLIPSLARLKRYYETETETQQGSITLVQDREEEGNLLSKFQHVLSAKFPQSFSFRPSLPTITRIKSNSKDGENDGDNGGIHNGTNRAMDVDMATGQYSWNMDDDDDEDGPVVVSSEEIEASMARSSATVGISPATTRDDAATRKLVTEYPLLAAAMMPSEDVLMTCARALDEKTDVSLVREAAAYLEQVEQQRGFF